MPPRPAVILVPRPAERSGALMRALRAAGYEPDPVPMIRIEPPEDPDLIIDLVGALARGRFDWLAVTSASAVKPLTDAAANLGLAFPDALGGARVAAVGATTAAALRAAGITVDRVATQASAEGLLDDWPQPDTHPPQVLLPHGNLARPALADRLRDRGWSVRTAVAYRTTPVPPPPRVVTSWQRGDYAGVILTSSSVARQLVATLGQPPRDMKICCIGQTTAATARELGLAVTVAEDPSPGGLVRALDRARPATA